MKKVALILRALLNCILVIIFFGLPLFLPAGTLRFWNAWLFLGLFDVCFLTILVYLALKNPEYAEKRFRGNETERPQRLVMGLLVTSALVMLVVAGFDYRFHWSSIPGVVVVAAAALIVAGFVMLFFVMSQNSYASRVVEIQEGQKVIDTGFYAIVRHPMYLAFTIIFCFAPVLLGSWYALIPVISIPVLLTFRIRNEEEVLLKGLKGYDAYVRKVKYRLVTFVW